MPRSSGVRAFVLYANGRGFKSHRGYHFRGTMGNELIGHVKNILRDIKHRGGPSNPAVIYIVRAVIKQLAHDRMRNFVDIGEE